MDMIDLRSDTVTQPTPAMREAMAKALVGDDVYGEDPTVNRLQEIASELTGKEAALYVVSGTMGNVAATLAHTRRGDEMICGLKSHIYRNEQGAMAALAGVQARPLDEEWDGTLDIQKIESAIQIDDDHHAITRVISIENTHNICNGSPIDTEYLSKVFNIAQENNLKVHTDGARIFNASVALNVKVKELAQFTDSITFCLSKGLTAPVGSMVCGTEEFIYHARRTRKILGGGMRQVGILAAAGLISISKMTTQLKLDHENLNQLANGLAKIKEIDINPDDFKTNILFFRLKNTAINDGAADPGFQVSRSGWVATLQFNLNHGSATGFDGMAYVVIHFSRGAGPGPKI